MLSFNKMYTL